jgi:hypothetical protein
MITVCMGKRGVGCVSFCMIAYDQFWSVPGVYGYEQNWNVEYDPSVGKHNQGEIRLYPNWQQGLFPTDLNIGYYFDPGCS